MSEKRKYPSLPYTLRHYEEQREMLSRWTAWLAERKHWRKDLKLKCVEPKLPLSLTGEGLGCELPPDLQLYVLRWFENNLALAFEQVLAAKSEEVARAAARARADAAELALNLVKETP
jgi:hypothetical protein